MSQRISTMEAKENLSTTETKENSDIGMGNSISTTETNGSSSNGKSAGKGMGKSVSTTAEKGVKKKPVSRSIKVRIFIEKKVTYIYLTYNVHFY
jgi:hypothetical protein